MKIDSPKIENLITNGFVKTTLGDGTLSVDTNAYIRLVDLSSTATGLTYTNTTGVFSLTSGYVIPTTTNESNWNTAYTNRITSLTTTGSSGAATLISNTLNIPNYTIAGLGGQPLDGDLTAIAALAGTSGFLKKTAADTWTLDTNTYLTGNQTITLSGDVSGSGATAITATLASIITAGGPTGSTSVVPVITYDAKGRLTAVTTATITPAAIGAPSGSGTSTGTNTGDETTTRINALYGYTPANPANYYNTTASDARYAYVGGSNASGTWGINISGNAATATLASTVTINYNNDSNSSYQMLWGSGNTIYGTAGVTINPFTDVITAASFNGLWNGYSLGTAATASYVALRDGAADITARLFRTEYTSGGGTGAYFLVQNAIGSGVDNYARPMVLADVKTTLGLGSMAYEATSSYYTTTQIQNFFSGVSAITGYNKTNWDTAYGWGNHASAGYVTASSTNTFTNKSGNISQWTNDSGYITIGSVSGSYLPLTAGSGQRVTGTIYGSSGFRLTPNTGDSSFYAELNSSYDGNNSMNLVFGTTNLLKYKTNDGILQINVPTTLSGALNGTSASWTASAPYETFNRTGGTGSISGILLQTGGSNRWGIGQAFLTASENLDFYSYSFGQVLGLNYSTGDATFTGKAAINWTPQTNVNLAIKALGSSGAYNPILVRNSADNAYLFYLGGDGTLYNSGAATFASNGAFGQSTESSIRLVAASSGNTSSSIALAARNLAGTMGFAVYGDLTSYFGGAATFAGPIKTTATYGFSIGDFGSGNQRILYGSDAAGTYSLLNSSNAYAGLYAGAATFSSYVNATTYYKTSDMRDKVLLNTNPYTGDIADLEARYYLKNGKAELGYFAQEAQAILSCAVSTRDDERKSLDLDYIQVLVAKVARLEQRVKELENK